MLLDVEIYYARDIYNNKMCLYGARNTHDSFFRRVLLAFHVCYFTADLAVSTAPNGKPDLKFNKKKS